MRERAQASAGDRGRARPRSRRPPASRRTAERPSTSAEHRASPRSTSHRFARERSAPYESTASANTAARKAGDSRNRQPDAVEVDPARRRRASAPARRVGRNGRTPRRAGEPGALPDVGIEAHVAPVLAGPGPAAALLAPADSWPVTIDRRLEGRRSRRRTTSSISRDLERYAGLFASRTSVMTSSAMRDLMAITARPEVISLAGGLPDTSHLPARDVRGGDRSASPPSRCAKALQYGPTEGLPETKDCIAEVMEAEGMRVDPEDMVVTTGGQQVIDLVAKTLIDPGDVVVAEGPTYPGAVPTFSSYQADVVQIDMDADGHAGRPARGELERLDREGRTPKFIYTVPSFQNPAGVTMSLPRRRKRLVEVAHERELLVLEDNPYGLLRYEGEPLPPLYLPRRGRLRDVPGHVLEDPLPRHPPRLGRGAAAGAREDQPRQAGHRPLHLDPLAADGAGLLRAGPLARLRRLADRDLPRAAATRCSTRSPTTSRPQAEWTRPGGGLFIWATLPDFIDTTDLLARALRDNVGLRARRGRLPRRPRPQLDAAQLLRLRRGRHPGGHSADRGGRARSRSSSTARSPENRDARRIGAPDGQAEGSGAEVVRLPSAAPSARRRATP